MSPSSCEQVALSSSVAGNSSEQRGCSSATISNTTSTAVAAVPTSSILPKALPDVDDVSMNQVTKYMDVYRQDVYWSFFSDSLFVAGGICYVILSTPSWNEVSANHPRWNVWLEYIAPTVYLLNSFVDVKWAQQVKKRTQLKNQMTDTWNYWKILLDKDDSDLLPSTSESSRHFLHEHGTTNEAGGNSNVTTNSSQSPPWYIRLRKHAAHRRTLLAAWTFGIAAFFSVLAVITAHASSSHPTFTTAAAVWGKVFDAISIHVYILSAVISVSGKRTRPWLCIDSTECGLTWLDNPETLEDLGDILFLLGSLVDGVLCDFTFDDNRPGWGITSSWLWLVDACLYLKADYIQASRMNENQDSPQQGNSPLQSSAGLFV